MEVFEIAFQMLNLLYEELSMFRVFQMKSSNVTQLLETFKKSFHHWNFQTK